MTALKAVPQQQFQNVSNSGNIAGLSVWLVSTLYTYRYMYACNKIIPGTS